jgi:type I restriction enzyme M protein
MNRKHSNSVTPSNLSTKTSQRKTVLDDLGGPTRNIYCRFSDLSNEASVETFFLSRLIPDLGYKDSQIRTKKSLDALAVGRGHRREKYKPDYALMYRGEPRCILDAKAIDESLNDWVEQCSGYCLGLNRKYKSRNPVKYFILSNGKTTALYEWDKEEPILTLDFSDFSWGNPKFEHLKSIVGEEHIATSTPDRLAEDSTSFRFVRPTTERARQLFATCHKSIWKSEGYGPGPAFMAFVKLMFVKLWTDQNLRHNSATSGLFESGNTEILLPKSMVTFSTHWIEQREADGVTNPIDTMFIRLRDEIEKDIQLRKKKRIFLKDEHLGLRPDTVKDVVRRLQHIDLFGIDEDLNGRLFETFLNATMRGRDLGQFFTPRSVVKMMTRIAGLRVTREKQDRVIDGCCGSGGFLIEALTVMRNLVRDNGSITPQEKDRLIDEIANNCIFGIDYGKDPPLARIARINMYLHGDGGSRIYYADALDKETDGSTADDPEVLQNLEELRESVTPGSFDVVLTNPPFSMTKEAKNPSEYRVLRRYALAQREEKSVDIRPSLRSSVMFIERYWECLAPHGKLITVIDDTLLSSSKFKYVRDFIRDRFIVKAIISLPGDTFRRSGSRVKTSVLLLEKKVSKTEEQPSWFYFFSESLGVDDLTPKASEFEVRQARANAQRETDELISGYQAFVEGDSSGQVLAPEHIGDRLDLRFCVPLLGRMAKKWRDSGIEVKQLSEVVHTVEQCINPAEYPDQEFALIKVSYDGKCEVESRKVGARIRADSMYRVATGQMVFSTIRATDGAIGIVPPESDGALVSRSSYTVFDCGHPEDTAYLWSVLRSYELRADMQSLSPGSGRYTTYWPEVGKILIPWLGKEERRRIGRELFELWEHERQMESRKGDVMGHVNRLGINSAESRRRWETSKAPQ